MDAEMKNILAFDTVQRLNYSIKEIINQQQLWVLTDEHGCVMLNTEDEDCIPVWPSADFAKQWATDDWEMCKVEAISLQDWFSRWTPGLIDDDLALIVFPNENEEGCVTYPDEFEDQLKQQQNKNNHKK
jgi:hypothetical protein